MNDPKTGFNYALSNDLAVLAVKSRFSECVEMEIADNFIPNSEVYVAGYPRYPSNPNYCSPCLKVLNEDEIEDEITKAFCNFDKRVISEGTIMNQSENDHALIANYSSTSGMSGSPTFTMNGSIPSLVGINIGGACVEFQYELGMLINLIRKQRWAEAENLTITIINRGKVSETINFTPNILNLLSLVLNSIIYRIPSTCVTQIVGLISEIATEHLQPLTLDHNVSVSCKHPIFQALRIMIQSFKNCSGCSFGSFEEFKNRLNISII